MRPGCLWITLMSRHYSAILQAAFLQPLSNQEREIFSFRTPCAFIGHCGVSMLRLNCTSGRRFHTESSSTRRKMKRLIWKCGNLFKAVGTLRNDAGLAAPSRAEHLQKIHSKRSRHMNARAGSFRFRTVGKTAAVKRQPARCSWPVINGLKGGRT